MLGLTTQTLEIVRGTILVLLFLGLAGWVIVRTLKKSEEPIRLIYRWGLTLFLIFTGIAMLRNAGPYMPLFALPFAIVIGLIWAPVWGGMMAKPLTSLFDGGSEEVEARPVYSAAEAQRNRGHYPEAAAEVRKQLAKFPEDYVGQMLLAQIHAEHLDDLPSAQGLVERVVNQEHSPRNIAAALQQLADWHLRFGRDVAAARQALGQIIERLPDTQFAQTAVQRIAHLPSQEQFDAMQDRSAFVLTRTTTVTVGLSVPADLEIPVEKPEELAAEYVRRLAESPLDTETREKLAEVYAEHYQRLDLAVGELEQLIQLPHEPAKHKVRWLNRVADLQIKYGGNVTAAEAVLRRILELFPDTAAADNAQTRLAYLKLELKSQSAGHSVKLGTYESGLGLKRSSAEKDAANANRAFRRLSKS